MFALFQEERIVAYATAEGLVEDIWGIHPQTLEQHRGKGYGRAVMSAATEHVLSLGKMPYYDAGPDNPAAMRIAEALGYWVYQEVVWN
jgi:predicted GNAT family acetyltransferase